MYELSCFRSWNLLLRNIYDRQEKEIEMSACEPYAMLRGEVHGEPTKASNTDTNNEESARVAIWNTDVVYIFFCVFAWVWFNCKYMWTKVHCLDYCTVHCSLIIACLNGCTVFSVVTLYFLHVHVIIVSNYMYFMRNYCIYILHKFFSLSSVYLMWSSFILKWTLMTFSLELLHREWIFRNWVCKLICLNSLDIVVLYILFVDILYAHPNSRQFCCIK